MSKPTTTAQSVLALMRDARRDTPGIHIAQDGALAARLASTVARLRPRWAERAVGAEALLGETAEEADGWLRCGTGVNGVSADDKDVA